jgi:hypothetical protein
VIELKFQPQCCECKDMDIKTETYKVYAGVDVIKMHCKVYCGHENVCKKITTEEKGVMPID